MESTATSMRLILDKSSDGEVTSPGGYLRGLIEKAQIGELHLDRSFYGRLSGAGGDADHLECYTYYDCFFYFT